VSQIGKLAANPNSKKRKKKKKTKKKKAKMIKTLMMTLCMVAIFAATIDASAIECKLCTSVVGKVENDLKGFANATEHDVEALLHKACSIVGPLEKECDLFVDEHLQKIVRGLLSDVAPEQICLDIHMCKDQDLQLNAECTVCKDIVSYAENKLKNVANATAADVEKLIHEACGVLGPLSGLCQKIVNKYASQLVQGILNGVAPEALCGDIGLCK
jgi:saposin